MSRTLHQLAKLVGAELVGDGNTIINNAATLTDAGIGDITLLDNVDRLDLLMDGQMTAVVMPKSELSVGIPSLQVENVHEAFAKIVREFHPPRPAIKPFISSQAYIDQTAKIGNNVTIYPFAYVGAEAQIGDNVVLHPHCCIMAGAQIGNDSIVYPGATVYENSIVGRRCILNAGSSIGANGFGYKLVEGRHVLCAQLGNTILADEVEVGVNSSIDRGAYGPTRVGEGTKIDNLVMVGHNCQIGKYNLLCAQVGIAGSTSTGDYVVMAGQVGVRDHVHIGTGAMLGAKCGVMSDIPENAKMLGAPACPEREQLVKFALTSKLPEMKRQIRRLDQRLEKLEQSPLENSEKS